jgi:hypothetical protein
MGGAYSTDGLYSGGPRFDFCAGSGLFHLGFSWFSCSSMHMVDSP